MNAQILGIKSLKNSKLFKTVGIVVMAFVLVIAVVVAPATSMPAHAAQCGGNIVVKAGQYWPSGTTRPHNAIWVDRAPSASQIWFLNARTGQYELVPNDANYGVRYSPIGQSGNQFIYGVSTTGWMALDWGRLSSWTQAWRWRVYYNC